MIARTWNRVTAWVRKLSNRSPSGWTPTSVPAASLNAAARSEAVIAARSAGVAPIAGRWPTTTSSGRA